MESAIKTESVGSSFPSPFVKENTGAHVHAISDPSYPSHSPNAGVVEPYIDPALGEIMALGQHRKGYSGDGRNWMLWAQKYTHILHPMLQQELKSVRDWFAEERTTTLLITIKIHFLTLRPQ